MELLIFVLIAGVAGYLLAGSRFSKPIDESAKKVADTTKEAAKTTGGWLSDAGDWVNKTLKLGKKPQNEVVDVAEVKPEPAAPAESAPAAAKQPSRRKGEDTKPE
jgi:hypothetical protein